MAFKTVLRFGNQFSSVRPYSIHYKFKTQLKDYRQDQLEKAAGMRFIQFLRQHDDRKRLGVVSENGASLIELSGGSCVSNDMIKFINQNISLCELKQKISAGCEEPMTEAITLLPPITNPGKIICIGLNYKDHCVEQNLPLPPEPIFFSKFPTALTGARGDVIAPNCSNQLDWEVELVVVIGKKAKSVPRSCAMDYVFGYTIAQDITARDWQKAHNGGQWLLGKSMDAFCPIGPSITHKSLIEDVNNLPLQTYVNGELKQNGNTSDMIFKIDDVIERLTKNITLMPGDIILTGTPNGVGMHRKPPEFLKPGDVVESRIHGLGKMVNKVVKQA